MRRNGRTEDWDWRLSEHRAHENAFRTMQRTGYNQTRNEQFVQRPELPNPA